jgi:uncharacterized membrane protein
MSALSTPFRIALLVSVCLNLLLAAALAGMAWRKPSSVDAAVDSGHARSLPDARRLERVLTPERRAVVMETLGRDRRELRRSLGEVRAAQAEVQRLLRQPEFDVEAFGAALAQVREREQVTAERVHAGLQRLAERLQPRERELLAESMQRRRSHREREADGSRGRGREHD